MARTGAGAADGVGIRTATASAIPTVPTDAGGEDSSPVPDQDVLVGDFGLGQAHQDVGSAHVDSNGPQDEASSTQGMAEVVPLFGHREQPEQTVTWLVTEKPGSVAAHRRMLEILFAPYPEDPAV